MSVLMLVRGREKLVGAWWRGREAREKGGAEAAYLTGQVTSAHKANAQHRPPPSPHGLDEWIGRSDALKFRVSDRVAFPHQASLRKSESPEEE